MQINDNRPFEAMRGPNASIIRYKLGRIHCCTPIREALQECRPERMRTMPVALRRGWVKFVLDTHRENLECFIAVTSGNLSLMEK